MPTVATFDPSGDILIAKLQTLEAQPGDLRFRFARIVSIGKIAVKNLASTAEVFTVTIKAAGKKMSNGIYYNLLAGLPAGNYYNAADNVVLVYEGQNVAVNGMTIYFTCLPFDFEAEGTLTVEITTTADEVFTKNITVPAGALAFWKGRISSFSVDNTTEIVAMLKETDPGIHFRLGTTIDDLLNEIASIKVRSSSNKGILEKQFAE